MIKSPPDPRPQTPGPASLPPRMSLAKRKARLAYAYLRRRPVWCTWQVTYRCNFRCRFCPYWKRPAVPDLQTVADFQRGARALAEFGSLFVSMAGGEPLLRKDFVDIVSAVSRYHFPFVTTNGWHVTPELARALWKADLAGASVSLDYADAGRHDAARGRKGAFERAIAALEVFRDTRVARYQRVNMMAVLMNDNLEEIEPLLKLATGLGVNFMVQPYAPEKNKTDRFVHRGSVAAELVRLKRCYPRFLSNTHFLSLFDKARDVGVGECRAGRAFFNIDDTGDVAVCVEKMHEPVGNLRTDAVSDIIARLSEAAAKVDCRACWHNCRGEVESLYSVRGVFRSLPILLVASYKNRNGETGHTV